MTQVHYIRVLRGDALGCNEGMQSISMPRSACIGGDVKADVQDDEAHLDAARTLMTCCVTPSVNLKPPLDLPPSFLYTAGSLVQQSCHGVPRASPA